MPWASEGTQYMLRQILAVRDHREVRAQAEVRDAQAALARAAKTREAAEDAFNRFQEQARRREAALLSELLAKTVGIREISAFNNEIGELRSNLRKLGDVLNQAEEARVQIQESLTERKAVHAVAWRHQQKLLDLVRMDAAQGLMQQEQGEEADVSEAAERRRAPGPEPDLGGNDAGHR